MLTGVRVQFHGDKVTMTSTDRFRLARATLHLDAAGHATPLATTALVRGSPPRDVAPSLPDEHQNVAASISMRSTTRHAARLRERRPRLHLPAHRRRIPGRRPPVSPTNTRFRPSLTSGKLIAAIKRVALVAERNAPIRMVFSGQEAHPVRRRRRRSPGAGDARHRHGRRGHHRRVQPLLPGRRPERHQLSRSCA